MRAPACDSAVMFLEVAIVAGEVTILDDISLMLGPAPPTVLIGTERLRQDHAAARGHGADPDAGRITWSDRGAGQDSPPTAAPSCSSVR